MAVLSKPLTLLSAAAATLRSGANGAAINKARDDPHVQCFPADAPGYVENGSIQAAIYKFTGQDTYIGGGVWLWQYNSFYFTDYVNGQKVALSINNRLCEKMWVDWTTDLTPYATIEDNCAIGPGGLQVGGSYTNECGNFIIQFGDVADPPSANMKLIDGDSTFEVTGSSS